MKLYLLNTSLLVDDVDPSIQYTGGPWFQDVNATDSPGYLGYTLFGTLHGTNSSASVSFKFNGTGVMAAGAFRNTTEGAVFPTWTCVVDDTISPANPFHSPENRWPLCQNDSLSDGEHIMTVQVQVPEGQQFWFDYMQYAPSENVPLDNANICIDSTNPDIIYGEGWSDFESGRGEEASTPGTSLNLTFNGISVIWVGIIPAHSTPEMSTMTYYVDGVLGGTANILGSPSTYSPDIFNQYFFQTAPVPVGEHVLHVVYNGNAPQSAPLVIDNFIILNRTVDTASMAPSITSGIPQTGSPKHSRNIGTLVGMAIGGCLALIALIILGFIAHRRRGRFGYRNWYNWTYRYPLDQDGSR